jgi:hypothetical protein
VPTLEETTTLVKALGMDGVAKKNHIEIVY